MSREPAVIKAPSNIGERESGVQPIDREEPPVDPEEYEQARKALALALYHSEWRHSQRPEVRLKALAAWQPGDDPRDLARCLGLQSCPTQSVEVTFVRGDRLHYPESASMADRARQILELLFARFPEQTAHLQGGAR
jgi:hypothetical protein